MATYLFDRVVYLVLNTGYKKGIQGKWVNMYWNPDDSKYYVVDEREAFEKGKMVAVEFNGEIAKLSL